MSIQNLPLSLNGRNQTLPLSASRQIFSFHLQLSVNSAFKNAKFESFVLSGPASMEKSTAYSHHLAESSSRNVYAEEANYRNKEFVRAEQVKLLDKRLRILEDEAEILKVVFLEGAEERRKLVNKVQNEFQAAFGYPKHQRHGLLQILSEESNPAVVIRKLRASDATECVSEFSGRWFRLKI